MRIDFDKVRKLLKEKGKRLTVNDYFFWDKQLGEITLYGNVQIVFWDRKSSKHFTATEQDPEVSLKLFGSIRLTENKAKEIFEGFNRFRKILELLEEK